MGALWQSDLLLPQHLQEVTYFSVAQTLNLLQCSPAQVPMQPVDLHQSLQEVVCHQAALHHFHLQEVGRPQAANLHMPQQEVECQLHPHLAVEEEEHRGPHPVVGGPAAPGPPNLTWQRLLPPQTGVIFVKEKLSHR